MLYLSADCIIPIEGEPCFNSVLVVEDDGTIEGIYTKSELTDPLYEIIHYNGILCPGFVNTHCHLELSWAKGLFSEGEGLDYFIWQLGKFRKSISEVYNLKAIEKAATEMIQSGTVATADIANGKHTLDFKRRSSHYFHTFVEVFSSDPANAEAVFEKSVQLKAEFKNQSLAASIVPHATYSLSDKLFRLIANAGEGELLTIHHQENEDENLFYKDGNGPIAARRKAFNPNLPAYSGTGKRPMESIAAYFDPDQKLLLVHNTVSQQVDIDFVQGYFKQPYWCLCPNANLFIEKKLPDIDLFRKKNCKITIGTDSLASNHQLSILEEIKTIQQHFPLIPLTELLKWSTLNGAEFLSQEQKLGSFVKGKRPGVVLIENADINTLLLKTETTSRLIIPAHT
ncbi:MAG: amidohydrolase family protein [Bacteroidales bacterium]|nr:amidohydrolase family protein [Bacteroidales bacterium]